MKYSYLLIITLLLSSCFKNTDLSPSDNNKITSSSAVEATINADQMKIDQFGLSYTKAMIKTVHGNIVFKFYPKHAPNSVTRIANLIKQGFYNGLIFHRVIKNFIIQTGDPTGTGKGGSGLKLKAEFNSIQHIKGTVALARNYDDKNSADSQFYISLTTLPSLDGKYTVFAKVIEGISILNKIQRGDKILSISLIN
jgi:cyclophilin family peptidyl-prolyl cis-trans isomerase